MRLILSVILISIPLQVAFGDDPAWLAQVVKQDDPNELAYFVIVEDDCPVSKKKVATIIEGVFVRSRVKPLGGPGHWFQKNVYLSAKLNCVPLSNNNPVYDLSLYFGNYSTDIPILYNFDFGSTGIGGRDFIEQAIKENVEGAITAYLKVNFDLGD